MKKKGKIFKKGKFKLPKADATKAIKKIAEHTDPSLVKGSIKKKFLKEKNEAKKWLS